MHIRSILNVLAALLTILGATMLLSAAWSFYYEEPDLEGLLMSSGITVAVSLPVWILTRRKVTLSVKDGFAIVTLAWFTIAIFSSLPFILTGTISMNSYDIEIFGCALHPLHGNLDNGNIEVFFAQPFGELKTDFTGTDNNYFHQSPLSQQDHFHGVIVHTHLHGTDICT